MFEKNIKYLKLKNPELANELNNYEYKNIEAYQTPSGEINIAYKSFSLHSDNGPMAEAEVLFKPKSENDSKNSFYIVYGLGLGYLLKRSYISSTGKIILFEPFIDILKFSFQFVDFSDLLSDNRVYICTSIKEILSILDKKYLVGDPIDVVFLPSYLKLSAEKLDDLSKEILSFVQSKKGDQNTVLQKAINWGTNSLLNFHEIKKSLPVDIFRDLFKNTPVVIASAGPSLEENLNLLKKYRDKYVLITVNSALRALVNNEIIPDFCVICEDNYIEPQFEGLQNLDKITYILHPRAQAFTWKLSSNINLLYLSKTDGFSLWFNKILNNKYTLWPSGGTVSIIALYIATLVFNSKKVIMVGQDLSFVNNQVYTPSTLQKDEKFLINEDSITLDSYDEDRIKLFNTIKVVKTKNYLGEDILTRDDYFRYITQYEDIIQNELPSEINIVNTSLKGAYVKGMTYMPFEKAILDIYYPSSKDHSIIEKTFESHKKDINENILLLDKKHNSFYRDLKKLVLKCEELIKIIEEFNHCYEKNPVDPLLGQLLEQFFKEKNYVSTLINQEEILFFIFQKFFLDYIQNYITPTANKILGLKEYANNLNCELKLLTSIHKAIIKQINRAQEHSCI